MDIATFIALFKGTATEGEVPDIGARVYNDAAITISTSTITALTFNQERHDPGSLHSTSTNTSRLTFAIAGTYVFGGNVRWDTNVTGERVIRVLKNGATVVCNQQHDAPGAPLITSIVFGDKFAAGDYIELQVWQNSGGDLDVSTNANFSPEFWAQLIAET